MKKIFDKFKFLIMVMTVLVITFQSNVCNAEYQIYCVYYGVCRGCRSQILYILRMHGSNGEVVRDDRGTHCPSTYNHCHDVYWIEFAQAYYYDTATGRLIKI